MCHTPQRYMSNFNNTRSTVFAFKCMIGSSLTRLDINATSRTNIVKQLFVSKQGDEHIVCLRIRQAISRTQFARMLEMVESNMRTVRGGMGVRNHLRRPSGVAEWKDAVFMGEELREGDGDVIRRTLRQHMEDMNPQYSESHSTTTRHASHMLRDSIRPNPNAPPHPPLPSFHLPDVAPSSSSEESGATLQIGNDNPPPPRLDAAPSSEEERSGAPPPRLDAAPSSEEERSGAPPPRLDAAAATAVFRPARFINGQPNTVEMTMEMAAMVSDILRTVLQVGPDFNMQQRFDNIDSRIQDLTDITRRGRRSSE